MSDVQATLKGQMAKIPINIENGTAFYKHLFTAVPDLRAFFKGSETIEPNAVPQSERFHKQGVRLLLSVHLCVETVHNPIVFKAYVREMINKHRPFKLQYPHYEAFWPLFAQYVEKMTGSMSAQQKSAWDKLAEEFNKEAKVYMGELGLA